MGKNEEFEVKPKGWRVSLSIGVCIGWLIFVIVWLAFFAGSDTYNFNPYQNFAIILVSILFAFMILGSSWASYGIKHIPKEGREMMRKTGFKSRVTASIIVPFALLIFWILWFFFYATNFDFYQNLAIFIVSILAVGGILGGLWAPWGMKYGDDWKCKETAGSYYHHEKSSDKKTGEVEKEIDEKLDKKEE